MYTPASKNQIAEILLHLRELFRGHQPENEMERITREKREVVTKNLLANLHRTGDHPTLQALLQISSIFAMTIDAAHQLFGYDLLRLREQELLFNRGRTRIIESYLFGRDSPVDLPLRLATDSAFEADAMVQDLIVEWQRGVSMRELERRRWHLPGSFYIQVGTDDSAESSLPPGAVGLVEPIEAAESRRPNPRVTYCLQFANGYRCSRCVVSGGRLILLSSTRRYAGPKEYIYPGAVRIVGRIRMFAVSLPAPATSTQSLPFSYRGAPLILPWEQPSLDRLLQTKHQRFIRLPREREAIQSVFDASFGRALSGRTERRYRRPTRSHPHVHNLMQMAVGDMARYSDALLAAGASLSSAGRFSLEVLLRARSLADLDRTGVRRTETPLPRSVWEARRREFGEWPNLLSARFPEMSALGRRIVRFSSGVSLRGLEPALSAGSLLWLESAAVRTPAAEEPPHDGWNRPLYVLMREPEFLCGYLGRVGDAYVLLQGASAETVATLSDSDLKRRSEACCSRKR